MRNVGTMSESDEHDEGIHGYMRYDHVRLPPDAMLGARARVSRWRRPGSAAAGCTTRCGWSASASVHST